LRQGATAWPSPPQDGSLALSQAQRPGPGLSDSRRGLPFPAAADPMHLSSSRSEQGMGFPYGPASTAAPVVPGPVVPLPEPPSSPMLMPVALPNHAFQYLSPVAGHDRPVPVQQLSAPLGAMRNATPPPGQDRGALLRIGDIVDERSNSPDLSNSPAMDWLDRKIQGLQEKQERRTEHQAHLAELRRLFVHSANHMESSDAKLVPRNSAVEASLDSILQEGQGLDGDMTCLLQSDPAALRSEVLQLRRQKLEYEREREELIRVRAKLEADVENRVKEAQSATEAELRIRAAEKECQDLKEKLQRTEVAFEQERRISQEALSNQASAKADLSALTEDAHKVFSECQHWKKRIQELEREKRVGNYEVKIQELERNCDQLKQEKDDLSRRLMVQEAEQVKSREREHDVDDKVRVEFLELEQTCAQLKKENADLSRELHNHEADQVKIQELEQNCFELKRNNNVLLRRLDDKESGRMSTVPERHSVISSRVDSEEEEEVRELHQMPLRENFRRSLETVAAAAEEMLASESAEPQVQRRHSSVMQDGDLRTRRRSSKVTWETPPRESIMELDREIAPVPSDELHRDSIQHMPQQSVSSTVPKAAIGFPLNNFMRSQTHSILIDREDSRRQSSRRHSISHIPHSHSYRYSPTSDFGRPSHSVEASRVSQSPEAFRASVASRQSHSPMEAGRPSQLPEDYRGSVLPRQSHATPEASRLSQSPEVLRASVAGIRPSVATRQSHSVEGLLRSSDENGQHTPYALGDQLASANGKIPELTSHRLSQAASNGSSTFPGQGDEDIGIERRHF